MMLENNLIKKCPCGNSDTFVKKEMNGLDVLVCMDCGSMHQELAGWDMEDYLGFYQYQYHRDYQDKKGVVTYYDRYDHDCKVADIRLDAYKNLLHSGMKGLDVGSSNSAFVHRAIARGINCLGLEPGDDIGDDAVTIRGTLTTSPLNPEQFDFITMHDSIEHLVDINADMLKVCEILKPGGLLIVDLPDYFSPVGKHHWKKVEHLWLFNRIELEKFLNQWGFEVFNVLNPIPGKFAFYARKR